jgi:hypothetical protein
MTGLGRQRRNCPDLKFIACDVHAATLAGAEASLDRCWLWLSSPRGCTASTAVPIDKKQRQQLGHAAELAHMRKLYTATSSSTSCRTSDAYTQTADENGSQTAHTD